MEECWECKDMAPWYGFCDICGKACECCGGTYYNGMQDGCLCCFSECCGGEEFFEKHGRCRLCK